jgi:thioredoxin reductase
VSTDDLYDVIIVGAGPAGLGAALALQTAGVDQYIIVDREEVGASFDRWPAETRFITPSFPTNSIGMLDINSIAIGVSPAHNLQVEHPTGEEYASHLRDIAAFFSLPICDHTEVFRIQKIGDEFHLETAGDTLRSKHVIWAAGEFQYPKKSDFEGSLLCRHTSTVPSYAELEGDDFIVIGGYESGIDAAYHLASHDKRVLVIDRGNPWFQETSDPSVALSTYSLERMRKFWFGEHVELVSNTEISQVVRSENEEGYQVHGKDGRVWQTSQPPLLANGFAGSHTLVADLFALRDDGFPLLNQHDESTTTPGMYLCGPAVRHDDLIFCYIFKYRQRFAVVAKSIATALGLPAEELESYRQWGMYLDDLSCCGEECVC